MLTGYSLAAILGGSCLGIVATLIALAPVLRRQRAATPAEPAERPQVSEWIDPARPTRCPRCQGVELVHVPRLLLLSEPAAAASHPLAVRESSRPIEVEMLVCTRCGRAEWFATSPRALEPFQSRPALGTGRPYRS